MSNDKKVVVLNNAHTAETWKQMHSASFWAGYDQGQHDENERIKAIFCKSFFGRLALLFTNV